jgi:hypothetical protein
VNPEDSLLVKMIYEVDGDLRLFLIQKRHFQGF